jgi:hypothetical protein
MLTSQRFGLRWLARPVAEFVSRFPRAEINYYPGDLTMMALKAYDDIAAIDEEAGRLIRETDYSWMAEEYTFSDSLPQEAEALVKAARHGS